METVKIDIDQIKQVYFLGIGGIGMSALAKFFHQQGKKVSGYDRTSTDLTRTMENMGISIHYHADTSSLSQIELVIFTPAITEDFDEFIFFQSQKIPMIKRSDALSLLMKGKKCIAVAGTHGKTSTSALLAHIWECSGQAFLGFVGGIVKTYESNLFLHPNADTVIVEADEYDRSFLKLFPTTAIVNATDPDHLDIYGTHEELKKAFVKFLHQCLPGSPIFLQENIDLEINDLKVERFGLSKNSPYRINNIEIENGSYIVDFQWGSELPSHKVKLSIPGKHNAMNALAASAAALMNGISLSTIIHALETFPGVQRRFDYILRKNDRIYIDDYAHHPDEINALLNTVLELYPDKKIVGVFQPHLFSRTKDLADEFAKALSRLPICLLMDIYPAREKPIPGINSSWLLDKIDSHEKKLVTSDNVCAIVQKLKPDVLISIGAGDIDRMIHPLKTVMEELS